MYSEKVSIVSYGVTVCPNFLGLSLRSRTWQSGAILRTAPTNQVIAPVPDSARNVFIARQPIFNERKRCTAYERLFRDGITNVCPSETLTTPPATLCTPPG